MRLAYDFANLTHLPNPPLSLWHLCLKNTQLLLIRHYKIQLPWSPQYQFSSVAQSCPTLCDPMNRSTPGHPVHHQLPESTQTHVHWVGDAIQPSHLLSSPSPPALNLSQDQGLFNESALRIRWPKDWSFSFHISPSNEHPGLISFMMDWLDLCAVQGTLKNLLQHHSSKASIYFQPYFSSVPLNSTTLVPKMWMQFSLIQVISIWNVWFYFFFSYPSTTTINEYFMSNMSS